MLGKEKLIESHWCNLVCKMAYRILKKFLRLKTFLDSDPIDQICLRIAWDLKLSFAESAPSKQDVWIFCRWPCI
jgi:hypothetical protein